jgi:hypothetical protein
MASAGARLDQLRGGAEPLSWTARTLAALSANPGCSRRAVLDAAGADKGKIAEHAGFGQPTSQSPIALQRGAAFEARVKARGGTELTRLLREKAGLALPEVRYASLDDDGTASMEARWDRTRSALLAAARSPSATATLYDHPMLRLDVGGHPAYLEPDVVAFRAGGQFRVIEVKSFALIDGRADDEAAHAAALQAAVYVIALQDLLEAEGLPPDAESADAILVTPENFGARATASPLDVRRQVAVLRRQLARIARVPDQLAQLPPALTFDLQPGPGGLPSRPRQEIAAALQALDARYQPRCLKTCELSGFCRGEARAAGSVTVLGTAARDDLGGLATAHTALALAAGTREPSGDEAEIARALRHAQRIASELEDGNAGRKECATPRPNSSVSSLRGGRSWSTSLRRTGASQASSRLRCSTSRGATATTRTAARNGCPPGRAGRNPGAPRSG